MFTGSFTQILIDVLFVSFVVTFSVGFIFHILPLFLTGLGCIAGMLLVMAITI